MDPEGVELSNHCLLLPQLPPRRGWFAEHSAIRPMNPGQGVEPRSPRSERGVLPVRRSRNVRAPAVSAPAGHARGRSRASPSIPRADGRSTQQASATCRAMVASSVSSARSRTMFSMPLAYPSTLDHRPPVAHIHSDRRPTWRGFGARASRAVVGKAQAKANAYCQRVFPARSTEGLSLSGGASIRSRACSS